MNLKMTKDEFFEVLSVFIVEEAKERGKDYIGVDPEELTEYEQLLAHIAKFPMKTSLKMARYRVDSMEKLYGKRLIISMDKADTVRILI